MEISKQCKTILEYMRNNGEISQREAYRLGVYRLSARIFDLKATGEPVITSVRTVTNADGSKSRVAFYRLAEVKKWTT